MAVYADRSQYPVNQGDIFRAVPFPVGRAQERPPLAGMVVSHDCDCDKFLNPSTPLPDEEKAAWRVTVAWVHPLSDLAPDRQKLVREDRMPRYVHLPSEGKIPELVVDLSYEQPVRMVDLLACKRIASLSPKARNTLWWKIVRLRLGRHFQAILRGEVPDDAA